MEYKINEIAGAMGFSSNHVRNLLKKAGAKPIIKGKKGTHYYSHEELPMNIKIVMEKLVYGTGNTALEKEAYEKFAAEAKGETKPPAEEKPAADPTPNDEPGNDTEADQDDGQDTLDEYLVTTPEERERAEYFALEKLRLITPKLLGVFRQIFPPDELRNILMRNYGLITE